MKRIAALPKITVQSIQYYVQRPNQLPVCNAVPGELLIEGESTNNHNTTNLQEAYSQNNNTDGCGAIQAIESLNSVHDFWLHQAFPMQAGGATKKII